MGISRSMDPSQPPEDSMAETIAPPPLELSTNALYAASITAFVGSILALSLAVSYIACALPLLVSIGHGLVLSNQEGWMRPICEDDHYKYVLPLLIPTTAWFVIANWVGWEYFRNA